MNNNNSLDSRIIQLRQVMSSFAYTCKPSEDQKLSSAENYAEWRHYVSRALVPHGADLESYFLTGSFDETGLSPEESALLAPHYETTLQTVLQVTVSADLIKRYGGYGSELLQNLMQELGVVTPRLVYKKVQEIRSLDKSLKENFDAITSFLRNFGSQLSLHDYFAFVLLSSTKSSRLEDIILNSPSSSTISTNSVLNIGLPIVSSSTPASVALAAIRDKSTTNKAKKNIICYRCGKKGHTSRYCRAPAPISPGPNSGSFSKSGSTAATSSPGSSNKEGAWMAIPAISEPDYTNFWMDSGATSHVCNNRNLFIDFSPCSQNLVGVGSDPLSILGTGTICFVGPNDHYLTLYNVLFVPDCRKCLVSLTQAVRSNPSLKFVTSVDGIFDGESGQRYASPIAENLFRFDYRPVAPHAASFSGFLRLLLLTSMPAMAMLLKLS
ncbi:unnamed protein product [[Candida] boidinii]|uniref:Unnamed protein product n=1 Tax=Candida boidinii TaxID=5477 RepID=A0A9W6WIR1_CANBO|nr:unnamed protein product [[Candida] boidinii]GMG18474.1 unnamed protein product [[Candida] boidinii]